MSNHIDNKKINSELSMVIERLHDSIQKSNLSYAELGKITGIAKSSIQRYATGQTRKIPLDSLEKIANAIGVSAAWIMGWEENPIEDNRFPAPNITEDYVTFPVIGEIAAGYDHIAEEDWSGDTVDVPTTYLRGRSRDEFFVLTVKGDSMYPAYVDGDRVLILRQSTLNRSGEVGAVIYGGENATLKKVEYVMGEDWMKLIPLNPNYPPITIEGVDLEQCRVIGIPWLLIREINQ